MGADRLTGNLAQSDDMLARLAAGVLMVGFPGTEVPEEMKDLIAAGVRNFVLFARNLQDPAQIRTLTGALQEMTEGEALIAIDHEGGRVMRLPQAAMPLPSPMALAAAGDPALTRRASQLAAEELASLGINWNFAPVADILVDHRNPVLGTRCFSDDPQVAAIHVAAFVEGHRRASVATSAKHFPGHGATPVDSHLDLPHVDRELIQLRAADLVPFAAAIKADVDSLMLSHIWYTSLDAKPMPATLSPAVIRLAREGMGYQGVSRSKCAPSQ